MILRPYGVRINTVGRLPGSSVGYQRSASRTAPSGIFAAMSRSTETSDVCGGGSLTMDAAIRLHTVIDDPPVLPHATPGAASSPPQEAWSSPKTIES